MDWIGWVIGALAIVISVVIYLATRIRLQLSWQATALELIGGINPPLPGQLEILFDGIKVPRVTRTNLVFWNSGSKTLYGSDVVKEEPIRIIFENDVKLLRATVYSMTRKVNKASAVISSTNANMVEFQFDYLDVGDGAGLEIINTGKPEKPKVEATIRGMPKGLHYAGAIMKPSKVEIVKGIIDLGFFGLLLIAGMAYFITYDSHKTHSSDILMMFIIAYAIIFGAFAVYNFLQKKRRYPKILTF